ncbi:Glutamate [NMDA] receptor subunit epsilon-2 [Echinococcus granulosus]|uniref:Glutamate [NMDA] receptor subunit epsilon-2 n=1 Tax=Echinococcus granulosus TaxID=6210 RepID=W6UR36_ECHGR|nr:Glutamate [NMDA] receptor subunit epsilon-2 [Echinococcus granulosus]EUB60782.1 Glutamate [NMDA] receptor subunit epsilon-2 [Echinococcus granulosus]
MNFKGEPISFLPNGGLNVSKFLIFNSRITSGRMNWFKVGTWSMSSKWGRSKSRLFIDGVTWPGGANSPPKGRAHRLKLKAVMLQEQPLLIYGNLQEDGSCDANSVPCWIRGDRGRSHKKLNSMVSIGKPLDGPKNLSFNERSETRQERQLACCTGLTMDLLIELMKDLNFEVELYEVKDRLWGGWTKEGWNGLVREIMEHKADMAITSLKITPNRSEQIDFSVPFLETGIAITVALREGAISPTAFLEPYDYQCWCIILLFSVHASGAAIYLYEWLSPVGQDRGRLVTPEHRFTMCRSLWLIWSMLFGAAVNANNPRGMASRFIANIWALFALVFLASYTANLAAFMISKDDFYDLEGIHDWRLQQPWNHKPPFRFATIPSGATEENIKINFPEMAAYMRAFNRTTVINGLKSLKSEEIDAFIYDATVLGYWTSRDDGCKLKTVGNLYAMTGYGIGFPKGSRWLPKINSRILHYQKNGESCGQSQPASDTIFF